MTKLILVGTWMNRIKSLSLSVIISAFSTAVICGASVSEIEKVELLAEKDPAAALEIMKPFLEEDYVFESNDLHVEVLIAAGKTFLFAGEFEKGLSYIDQCLSFELDDLHHTKALIVKGLICFRLGRFDESRRVAMLGAELAESIQNPRQIASAVNLLGNLDFVEGNIEGAIAHYVEAISLFEGLNEDESLVKLRANLGNIYLQIGQYKNARAYLEPCFEQIKDSNDAQMLLVIGLNLAAVYGELGDMEREHRMYLQALEVGKTSGMDSLLVGVYLNLSDLDIRRENWDSALENANMGMEMAKKIGDPSALAVSLINIGKANAGIGDFDRTFEYFDEAMLLFKDAKMKLQEVEVLGYYSEYYAKAGRFREAYESEIQHNERVAEMATEANVKKLQELRAQLDSEQQQLKIETLEAEKREQELQSLIEHAEIKNVRFVRNSLIAGIFACVLLLVLLVNRYSIKAKSNQELRQLNHDLNVSHGELQKLHEQKKQLLAIVSHDLRNPLHGILGLVEAIREVKAIQQSEENLEIVDMIDASANRAMEIVKNLLNSDRIQSGNYKMEMEPCKLFSIVQQACCENGTQARLKQQELRLHCESTLENSEVIGNKDALLHAVSNLISNAVKYTEVGKLIEISITKEQQILQVRVKDQGQGIAKEELQSIFEPYSTAASKATAGEESVGLGLSIVKSLVELMDGEVRCESELGKGAEFILSLRGS